MPEEQNEQDKIHKLDDLNRRLYSRSDKFLGRKKEHPLSKFSYGIQTNWSGSTLRERPKVLKKFTTSYIFKGFFIFSLVIFIMSAIFTGLRFYGGSNNFSPENIDILISSNAFINSGDELDLNIYVTNRNQNALEGSSLTVEYQRGETVEEGTETGTERTKIDLGKIEPGETKEASAKAVLFGKQGSRKIIKTIFEYRATGSSATFVKEESTEVVITNVPINISVDAPTDINTNQDLVLNVKISSNMSNISKNILLSVDYPTGFVFKEGVPEVFSGENVWNLGDIAPGAQKTIMIKGTLSGEASEEKIFKFSVGEQDKSTETSISVLYNQYSHTVTLSEPSISVSLAINGKDQEFYAVQSQNKIVGQINWSNNLSGQIQDVQIEAKVLGNVLNKSSIKPKAGVYDSLQDKVIWDKETVPDFATLEPGSSGSVSFEFQSLPIHSPPFIDRPEITIEVSIHGKRLIDNNIQEIAVSDRMKTVRFVSNLQLAAKALYYSGAFASSGPIPPKVNQKTNYTIVWSVTNSVSDVSKGEVRAKLAPFGVAWANQFLPAGENVTYNPLTTEIVWKVGDIKKGTGFTSDPRELSFVIELTPTLAQVDSTPPLIDESVLTGEDSYTDVVLKSSKPQLNTRLSSDSGFKTGDEKVAE